MRLVRLLPAGVVLLALGAIGAAAQFDRPASTGPSHAAMLPRQTAVTSADRACPPVQGGGSGTVAFVAGPPSPASGSAQGPGKAALTALPLAGVQLRATSPISQVAPGVLQLLTIPAVQSAGKKTTQVLQGWSVLANGTLAQAMEAEEAQSSGLSSVRCGEPGSDIWFVGPGRQGGAAQVQLDLMNVDALAASVDVSVITDAGRVQAGTATGITVPPHQTVTESLSSLAAGSSVVAVEVHTSIGRVAADVSENSNAGTSSWLPSAAPPSTQVVIPGVPPSSSAAGLYIVVPGSADARVSVLAVTPQGFYRPFGTQTEDLPGGSASYVPLTPLGGTACALELTSNVPVTAAVLVPGSGLGTFTAATAHISEQAVVSGNTSGSGLDATVILSAPVGAAQVRLTEMAEATVIRGTVNGATATESQIVSVRAGHTVTVRVSDPRGARGGTAFAIVITPVAGSGPVYAARVETQGQNSVVSIIPAVSALTTISLPPVRDSYDAISP